MTPRAAPLPPDDRRRAIVEAVVPLVIAHGEVSTRAMAEAAGVAEGTLFRAFRDKSELMCAVAREAIDPAGGREALAERLAGVDDLRDRVRLAAEVLTEQVERATTVMFAVRRHLPGPDAVGGRPRAERSGPPDFLVRANHQMLGLLELVFEPHATRMRVPVRTAALVLRSLVFGSRHPGMTADGVLTPEQIAAIVVDGVTDDRADRGAESAPVAEEA